MYKTMEQCVRVVVDDELPLNMFVGSLIGEIGPSATRARMKFSRVSNAFGAIGVEGVLGREVDEECSARFGETERVIVHSDDIRIHCRLDAVCELVTGSAAMQERHYILAVVDDAEAVRGTAGVEHAVSSLDSRSNRYRRRPLKDRLRSFVPLIPRLHCVIEEKSYAAQEHLPR